MIQIRLHHGQRKTHSHSVTFQASQRLAALPGRRAKTCFIDMYEFFVL